MRGTVPRGWRAVVVGGPVVIAAAGVLLATGLLDAGARASARVRYGIAIQAVFDRRGDPVLVANFVPDGDLAQPHWRMCRPGQACQRVPARDRGITPGPEPPATRMIATATYRGHTYTASRMWHGQVRALSPPTRTGPLAVRRALHLVAGRWSGGWGGETDQLGAEACRTRRGQGCRMLAGGEQGCPDASSHRRLGGWFTGAYVFVVDARLASEEICAGTGYYANADLPLWRPGPTVSRSGPVGRISGPPRPTVTIPHRARATGDRVPVATVRCRTRCHARVDVLDGRHGAAGGARFTGRHAITVPAHGLAPGTLHVEVHVDDGPAIDRRVLLGADVRRGRSQVIQDSSVRANGCRCRLGTAGSAGRSEHGGSRGAEAPTDPPGPANGCPPSVCIRGRSPSSPGDLPALSPPTSNLAVWNGRTYRSPRTVTVRSPLGHPAVFTRPGPLRKVIVRAAAGRHSR